MSGDELMHWVVWYDLEREALEEVNRYPGAHRPASADQACDLLDAWMGP